ncbi:MAG: hypothetical protein K6G89_06930 [Clostridia bacterium]|nr:hypothetical protein [Clostridia bacterium]
MRNFFNLFRRIRSFDTVTLHTSGMRHVTDYEMVMKENQVEVTQYEVGFPEGEEVRVPLKSSVCSANRALKLLNRCQVLSWDGFVGKHPKGIKDGTTFNFNATVNGGIKIYANGSQNFPPHYRKLKDEINEILNESKKV